MNIPTEIMLTAIRNPFAPQSSRSVDILQYNSCRSIKSYIDEKHFDLSNDMELAVSVNGKLIQDLSLPVLPGSSVVFCVVPKDDALRTLAFLAVMAASIYFPPLMGLSPFWTAMVSATIATTGSYLVNIILPPPMPDAAVLQEKESPTYGWTPRNPTQEGGVFPVLFGTTRIRPPELYSCVDPIELSDSPGITSDLTDLFVGLDITAGVVGVNILKDSRQRMHKIYGLTDHKIDSVSDLKINQNSHSNYTFIDGDVGVDTGPAGNMWEAKDWEMKVLAPPALLTDSDGDVITNGNNITAIALIFYAPGGLGVVADDGAITSAIPEIEYHYRIVGAPAWTDGYYAPVVQTRRPVRFGLSLTNLPAGQYEINIEQVTNLGSTTRDISDLYFEYIIESEGHKYYYPGIARLEIEEIASDKISGSINDVTVIATRDYVDVYIDDVSDDDDGTVQERAANNPAWVAYSMHTDTMYGAGEPYSRMIYSEFKTWADYCDAHDPVIEIGIYFDMGGSFEDQLAKVETIGRARVVQRGTKFGVIIDRPSSMKQMFGMGNIIAGTFKEFFISAANRASVVETTYWDADKDYAKKTFQLRLRGVDAKTLNSEPATLLLVGCTNRDLAIDHSQLMLNGNVHYNRGVQFDVQVDAIASTTGNVVGVSHDVPAWGKSGRIVSGAAGAVTIDQQVLFEYGETYSVLSRSQTVQDDDEEDTIETHALTNPTTGGNPEVWTAVLTNSDGNWTNVPDQYAIYAFGKTNMVVEQFRIADISMSSDQRRTIRAIIYNSDVYLKDAEVSAPESITDMRYVSELTVQEIYILENGVGVPVVALDWRGFALKYRVYVKNNTVSQADWALAGETSNSDYNVYGLLPGTSYSFLVTHTEDVADGVSTGPLVFNGLTEQTAPIDASNLQQLGGGLTFDTPDVTIVWDEAPNVVSFLDYKIEVHDEDSGLLSTYYTKTPLFTYTFEDNLKDAGPVGTDANKLTFKVKVRNFGGIVSLGWATLANVYNTAPVAPANLAAQPVLGGVRFSWDKSTANDFKQFEYRTRITSGGSWSSWSKTVDNYTTRSLTESEVDTYGNKSRIYIEVRTVDIFLQESAEPDSPTDQEAHVVADNIFQLVSSTSIDDVSDEDLAELIDGDFSTGGVTVT